MNRPSMLSTKSRVNDRRHRTPRLRSVSIVCQWHEAAAVERLAALLTLPLLLGASLAGCSTAPHLPTDQPPLYLFWGSYDRNSAFRFLSAQIHLNESILVGGDDFLNLSGHIDRRGTSLAADLVGSVGGQAQFYRGKVILEKPSFAQGGASSGGAGPPYWFLLSTNWDCRAALEQVNAVKGLGGQPFYHSAATEPLSIPDTSTNTDPATGLPWGNQFVDPINGLPLPPKENRK